MEPTIAALPLAPLPAPVPRKAPPNAFEVFAGMRRNPITLWTQAHFARPSVTRRGIMGLIVALQDPAAIRHVLVDNAANYRKDPLQLRVLRPMFGDGILTAEGEAWRRLRRTAAPGFVPRRVAAFAPAMDLSARAATAGLRDLPAGSPVQVDVAMADVTLAVLAATVFPGGLGTDASPFGTTFYGTNGTFHMGWRDGWTYYPKKKGEAVVHQDPKFDNEKDGHNIPPLWADFLQAIETGAKPVADIETAHLSTNLSLLGMLSYKLGRSIAWDGAKEEIPGDAEASALLRREYRGPWVYPA
jgi:hypothetical protein